jgi:hypothetical protein
MSKRARGKYERNPRDFYRTPLKATRPLLPYLPAGARFIDPCAGAGDLVDHLTAAGHVCVAAYDTEPQRDDIERRDAMTLDSVASGVMFITNLPWSRTPLHSLIAHLSDRAPLWNLLDSDWAFTRQAEPLLDRCDSIISVARVRWIAGTKYDGYDNASWYRFNRQHSGGPRFYTKHQTHRADAASPASPERRNCTMARKASDPDTVIERQDNAGEPAPQTATPAAPDPFDLQNLLLPQNFHETAGVKKLLRIVPVRKPNKQDSIASIPMKPIAEISLSSSSRRSVRPTSSPAGIWSGSWSRN